MSLFPLKPTHAPVKAYYAALAQFSHGGHHTEGNTRSAFADQVAVDGAVEHRQRARVEDGSRRASSPTGRARARIPCPAGPTVMRVPW